jgi:hypothetical protein
MEKEEMDISLPFFIWINKKKRIEDNLIFIVRIDWGMKIKIY